MRCSSYCTADSYDLSAMFKDLSNRSLQPTYYEDVVHVNYKVDKHELDVLYFAFGCVIIWGANHKIELETLNKLKGFEQGSLDNHASDILYFSTNTDIEQTYIDEEKNEIILSDASVLLKLSVSYANAQSVKLNILELAVSKLLDETHPIHKQLASTGKISLSKNQISKQIGTLFSKRYSINLHSDILDTPEFFWRRPRYEPLYLMTAAFQDIQVREAILNKRLDMIHDLYSLLSQELNYKHSTRLEMVIVILIGLELMVAFCHTNMASFITKIFTG